MDARTDHSAVVAVAMSGGVDSAVAAALLKTQGRAVFGVTARMTSEYSRCCSDEDLERAAAVAESLGIDHHVVDVRLVFKEKVIDHFMSEYLAGRTPSPCVPCNRYVKFGALLAESVRLGADMMATGHYARVSGTGDGFRLWRGVDGAKDQSYFLAGLSQAQLGRTTFPLGAMHKHEVTSYAHAHHLFARASRESQELCFVTHGTHGDYIDLRSFETRGAGEIVDPDGKKLGTHRGIHHYTIGQRKGLGIAAGKPVYVVAIDAAHNRIVAGERDAAMRAAMTVERVNWISGRPPREWEGLSCQIRYRHDAAACRTNPVTEDSVDVVFDRPQFAITPGQLAVFYRGDEVIGGGWIGDHVSTHRPQ